MAPMKAYLKNYKSFKNSYLKKVLYHKQESWKMETLEQGVKHVQS